MTDPTIEHIIFLSYLTKYNISEIYKILNDSSYREFRYAKNKKLILESKKSAETALDRLKYHNIDAIPFYSPSYPKTLSILKDAPPILYIRGKLRMRKLVAIVGSRNASPVAEQVVK